MNRFSLLAALVIGSLPFTVGCATKNYVRNEITPIINNVNELDDRNGEKYSRHPATSTRARNRASSR